MDSILHLIISGMVAVMAMKAIDCSNLKNDHYENQEQNKVASIERIVVIETIIVHH